MSIEQECRLSKFKTFYIHSVYSICSKIAIKMEKKNVM